MGFEPTISTLGKLHVDPYTKPARKFLTTPSITGAGVVVKSNVGGCGHISTGGGIIGSIANILREVADLRGFALVKRA